MYSYCVTYVIGDRGLWHRWLVAWCPFLVGVRNFGCLALVGTNDIAKDDGKNNGETDDDEPKCGVLQTSATVAGLGGGLAASRQWVHPNAVARVTLEVIDIGLVGCWGLRARSVQVRKVQSVGSGCWH